MLDPKRDPTPDRLGVKVLNAIAASGLSRFPAERYRVGKDVLDPAAILLRSADMHEMTIPTSVRAVGRAGAGTNNIPVAAMSARGVPVFNAPGANANAVKELVLAGMFIAARQIAPALTFVQSLDVQAADLDKVVEDGKKAFAGYELAGQTLGIIGLGKIGCLIADAAIKLGMNVLGHDPEITVDAAFLKGAEAHGMVQLKGHRAVGGMRASIYNAMPVEGVEALVAYMKEFERSHG